MEKLAVLFLNFGGPKNLKEVRPFLFRLFTKKEILFGIPLPLRIFLAAIISLFKGHKSKKNYAKIGGYSPQLKYTIAQAEKTVKILEKNLGYEVRAFIGMRSSKPSFKEALKEIKKFNPKELVILPLFPQNSLTTSIAYLQEMQRLLRKEKLNYKTWEIRGWHNHPTYIKLQKKLIDEKLSSISKKELSKTHILFSAHSLPLKVVKKGDVYPKEIEETVYLIAKNLNVSYSLAYQSRTGGIPWLKPYTDEEILRLAKEGIRNLLVVPISFVSDHIETLYELDIEYYNLAQKAGIKNYLRLPTFNDSEDFAQFLAKLIEEKITHDRGN